MTHNLKENILFATAAILCVALSAAATYALYSLSGNYMDGEPLGPFVGFNVLLCAPCVYAVWGVALAAKWIR